MLQSTFLMPYTPRFLRMATVKSAENSSPPSAEVTPKPIATTGILSSSADIIALQNKAVLLRSGEMLNIHLPPNKQSFDTASWSLETIARVIISTIQSQHSSTLPKVVRQQAVTAIETLAEMNKISTDRGLEHFFKIPLNQRTRKPMQIGDRDHAYYLTMIDTTFQPFQTLMTHIVDQQLAEVFAVRVGDWDIDLPVGTTNKPEKLAQLLPQSIANFKSYL